MNGWGGGRGGTGPKWPVWVKFEEREIHLDGWVDGWVEPKRHFSPTWLQYPVVECEGGWWQGMVETWHTVQTSSSAQNELVSLDESVDGVAQAPVNLAWVSADLSPLRERAPHENLCGKYLVDLITGLPCAAAFAACNRAVHAERMRTELVSSDMGESVCQSKMWASKWDNGENTQGPLKSYLKQFVSFSGNASWTSIKINITTPKFSMAIFSSAWTRAYFSYTWIHNLGTLMHLLFLPFPLSIFI